MKDLRVGIAQFNPIVGNFSSNTKKILDAVAEGERRGLDWIVFSELALCGYPVWDLALRKNFVDEGLKHLKKICDSTKGKNILVFLGFIDRGPAGSSKNYNAIAAIHRGKIVHKQYKTLLPTYDVFLEHIFFEPADKQKILSFKGLKIGTSICEDIWDENYDVKPVRSLVRQGAKVIINISASPFHGRVACVRDQLIRKKARETKAFLIYVNQVGGQDDLIFDGRSLAASPDGSILFRGEPFQEKLYEVTLPLEGKKPSRKISPLPKVSRELGTGKPEEMYQALVTGVRDYTRKNGFKKVVLGLSGGIDSALTAAIAVDALGPEAVIGIAMPGEFSSEDSYRDAKELAKLLKMEFRVRPITKKYRSFLAEIIQAKEKEGEPAIERDQVSLAMQNLQARLRGMSLMYLSNDEGAMLLSTGNKSELATGYCTLYGDMSGGLCVLGDVYKTDVYRLCEYRNSLSFVIPRSTIKKAPTAELKPDQKDQDTLPPYEILDQILYLYIEENLGRADIARRLKSKGISAGTVNDAVNRVDFNEYKRRQAPPILRISEKAWFGRRMPITNHFRG